MKEAFKHCARGLKSVEKGAQDPKERHEIRSSRKSLQKQLGLDSSESTGASESVTSPGNVSVESFHGDETLNSPPAKPNFAALKTATNIPKSALKKKSNDEIGKGSLSKGVSFKTGDDENWKSPPGFVAGDELLEEFDDKAVLKENETKEDSDEVATEAKEESDETETATGPRRLFGIGGWLY